MGKRLSPSIGQFIYDIAIREWKTFPKDKLSGRTCRMAFHTQMLAREDSFDIVMSPDFRAHCTSIWIRSISSQTPSTISLSICRTLTALEIDYDHCVTTNDSLIRIEIAI